MTTADITVRVTDPGDMEDLGRRLARVLSADDAVCLSGPLGAGKTTVTRGIAAGLGVEDTVASPTFVIARRSRGSVVDLLHCDVYRLTSPAEFDELGIDPAGVVTVVEWGQSVMSLIADSWLDVSIGRARGAGDEVRSVVIRGVGPRWAGTAWSAVESAVCGP